MPLAGLIAELIALVAPVEIPHVALLVGRIRTSTCDEVTLRPSAITSHVARSVVLAGRSDRRNDGAVLGAPAGDRVLTFLMTDMEGSTALWERHGEVMNEVLRIHDDVIRAAVAANGGSLIQSKGEGDSTFSVFDSPAGATAAALEAQMGLGALQWPHDIEVRVRMSAHSGLATSRQRSFYGATVNRTARIRSVAHGGQVVVSQTTVDLSAAELPPACALIDLGLHRLKDLAEPQRLYQLAHPDLPVAFPPLRSLDPQRHNLPVEPTSFVGRDDEARELVNVLAQHRLTTLVGPGGTGKTRLALHVAAELSDTYEGGVWFVELASLDDPSLVARQMADVLGVAAQPGASVERAITEHLRPIAALLVVDNCEHVIESVAALLDALTRSCPSIRVLATSREALQIPSEHRYLVEPLRLEGPAGDADGLGVAPAIELFCARAAAVSPTFRLDADNEGDIAAICAQLDGMPLALELAAAHVHALSARQLNERLADRFRLLTRGRRTGPERHRTLEAALDWSYDLLAADEQRVLRAASVWQTAKPLEAIEAVATDVVDVFAAVERLVGASLLIADVSSSAAAYRMLETVRTYGERKALEHFERDRDRDAHARWCLALATQLGPQVRRGEPSQAPTVIAELERHHGDFRAALQHAIDGDDPAVALGIGVGLTTFWWVGGHLHEGQRWLSRSLSLPGDVSPHVRAQALSGLAYLESQDFRFQSARSMVDESLAIYRSLDPAERDDHFAYALFTLAELLTSSERDYDTARAAALEGLALVAAIADGWGIAHGSWALANVAYEAGDLDRAFQEFKPVQDAMREAGVAVAVIAYGHRLGQIARAKRDFTAARAFWEETLELRRGVGADRLGRYHASTAENLRDLALVCLDLGDPAAATYALEARERAMITGEANLEAESRALLLATRDGSSG